MGNGNKETTRSDQTPDAMSEQSSSKHNTGERGRGQKKTRRKFPEPDLSLQPKRAR